MVSASAADESRSAMTQRAVDDLTRLFQPINLRPTFALTKSNEPSSAATRGGGGGAFGGAPGMRRTAPPTAASTFGAPAGGFGSAAPPGSSLFGSAPRYVCRVSERLLLVKKKICLVTHTLGSRGVPVLLFASNPPETVGECGVQCEARLLPRTGIVW